MDTVAKRQLTTTDDATLIRITSKSYKWNRNNFYATINARGESETVCKIYCIERLNRNRISFQFSYDLSRLLDWSVYTIALNVCLLLNGGIWCIFVFLFSLLFLQLKTKNQIYIFPYILFIRNGPAYWMAAFVCTFIWLFFGKNNKRNEKKTERITIREFTIKIFFVV